MKDSPPTSPKEGFSTASVVVSSPERQLVIVVVAPVFAVLSVDAAAVVTGVDASVVVSSPERQLVVVVVAPVFAVLSVDAATVVTGVDVSVVAVSSTSIKV